MPFKFSLAEFGRMIADRTRMDAHAEALRRVVGPSSIVVDIGAGTGIMSLLACQAGARRVYAIEPSDAVQILLQAARDNGCGDRITVLQKLSTEVTLPERADVIVSDLRGVLPPHRTHFADIIDARQRLLAPGGRLLPDTDTLRIAVVTVPELFEQRRGVWQSAPHGLDLRSALGYVGNTTEAVCAEPEQLLSDPVSCARFHYPTLSELPVRGSGTCFVSRDGIGHGLLVWFDTVLVDGVGYSNAPGSRGKIYGQMFFPWAEAVPLQAGDTIGFDLRADPVGEDYLWTWTSEVRRGGDSARGVARMRQSVFNALPISLDALRKRAPSFAPGLAPAGALTLRALEGMRAGKTVGELASELQAENPRRFRSLDDAHGFVAELSERYGV
jgi:protein arginine N-methyltransferase 1